MKDENKKIDAFFSARLQNEAVKDDDWNMPSDSIWEAAKPKFVDRKKPRRRFMFWLLIPILALCLSIPLKLTEGTGMATIDASEEHLIENANNKITENETRKNIESKKERINISSSSIQTEKMGTQPEVQTIKIEPQPNSSPSQEENNADTEVIKSEHPSTKKSEWKKSLQSAIQPDPAINNTNAGVLDYESFNTKNIESKNTQPQVFEKIEDNEKSTQKNEKVDSEIERQELVIPFLNTIYSENITDQNLYSITTNLHSNSKMRIDLIAPKLITPLVRPNYKNEIGISHTELLLNLFLAFEIQTDNPDDQISISNTYFNANATGRKWLNRKWSFMTGVQYSHLDLDVVFSVSDTLDKELKDYVNEEFNAITRQRSQNDEERDIDIVLKDGIDPQIGDLLNIKGDVKLKVRAIQIPFFLDYHIYKRKFEYTFGFGATLDYLNVSEIPKSFEIYKSNQLISKPVMISEYKERYFDGSLYLKTGIRYSISERFNIGLDAKINLLELPFSGLDAGFYYRWN